MSTSYFFRIKISDEKFRTVLRLFCLDIEAKKTAEFTGLSHDTVNNIYNKLRERIAQLCEAESPFTNGEVELDESYFGARRVLGIDPEVEDPVDPCAWTVLINSKTLK